LILKILPIRRWSLIVLSPFAIHGPKLVVKARNRDSSDLFCVQVGQDEHSSMTKAKDKTEY